MARKEGKNIAKAHQAVEARPYPLPGGDPRHADQMVRGTLVLPHGLGKSKRVLVIASGEKMREAEEAGADIVGGEELVKKIQEGWADFDAVIATPDMMKSVGR